MKKPKVIYHNKSDNNSKSNLDDQKFGSATRSRSPVDRRSSASQGAVVTGSASLYSLLVSLPSAIRVPRGERARSQNQHFWSSFKLVLRRLIHNKKEKSVLDLYSHFLQPLVRRRSISGLSNNTNKSIKTNNYIKNYINNSKNIRIAGITSLSLLVLLSISILTPIHSNITNVEATSIGIKAESVLNITSSNNIAGVDLLVKDSNGTFASSSEDSLLSFSVTTDNSTGYTLSIVSPSDTTYNDGRLTNTDTKCSTNCTLSSINSASNTISTNGTWGYKPSKLNSTENNNYLPSPTTTPTILDETNTANTTPNSYSIAIGAKADYTQPTGVYSNTYTLQATSNIVIIYMQDVSKDDLSILLPNAGDTTTLYDNRDNQAYTVGKLADGNYWLLDNLALDLTNTDVQKNLSSDTTNATDDELVYLLGTKTGTTSDQYATSKVADWTSTSYSYSDPWIAVDSATSGDCNNPNYCVNNDDSIAADGKWASTVSTSLANNGADKYPGKIGIYYNYCAATAGTYCYGNSTSYGTPSGNATSDICPSGWRIPTGGSSGEYKTLYDTYSSGSPSQYAAFRNALQVPLSGYFGSGRANYQGINSALWSSTHNNTYLMYALYVDASNVRPANYDIRNSGNSVRCIKSDDPIYMQAVTDEKLAELIPNNGDSATLIDRRDGSDYQITKINNDYWMTQNLRITHSAGQSEGTILGEDSDFSAESITMINGTNFNDYSVAQYHAPTASDLSQSGLTAEQTGIWYSFCAAAAKSGTGACTSSTYTGSESICPSGWYLPSRNITPGALSSIVGNVTTGGTNNASYFKPVRGGFYSNNTLSSATTYGLWWSSTAADAYAQYLLYYSNGVLHINTNGNIGSYIRCVRTS